MPRFIDKTGSTIAGYAVVGQAEWYVTSSGRRRPQWTFRCPCGEEFVAESSQVQNGLRSCQRCRFERKRKDLSGRTFGRLLVSGYARSCDGKAFWTATCTTCGKTFEKPTQQLEKITICPCPENKLQHGHAKTGANTATYKSWNAMLNRCRHPSTPRFDRYGGRGIRVCERWESFENFLTDMGERPPGTSLDRIDGDGHYEPGNCRWATRNEQRRNMDENTIITFRGISKTLADWAEELGINRQTLRFRYVRAGWSAERSLTEPVGTSVGQRGPGKKPR